MVELFRIESHPLAKMMHELAVEWEKVPGSIERTAICTEISNLRDRMQALLNQPADSPRDGATHVHYKGGRYRKLCEAQLEAEPETTVVIYKSIERGYIWAREKNEFLGEVAVHVTRFKPL
jgi:hypothetical protein